MSGAAITAIKATRIIRFLKIARFWKGFEVLLETLKETLVNIKSFVCLLVIVMYIYILLGQELFGNKSKFNSKNEVDIVHGQSPIFNFDNFKNSLLTNFSLLTIDGLSAFFFTFYRSVGSVPSILFFISFNIFAQNILFKVFIAKLLQHFEEGAIKSTLFENQVADNER